MGTARSVCEDTGGAVFENGGLTVVPPDRLAAEHDARTEAPATYAAEDGVRLGLVR